jgi:hypothetical protein
LHHTETKEIFGKTNANVYKGPQKYYFSSVYGGLSRLIKIVNIAKYEMMQFDKILPFQLHFHIIFYIESQK